MQPIGAHMDGLVINFPIVTTGGYVGNAPDEDKVAPIVIPIEAEANITVERGTLGKIMDLCTTHQIVGEATENIPLLALIQEIIDLITADGK